MRIEQKFNKKITSKIKVKDKKNKINMDFDVLNEIKKVEVSPFFKHKALREIDNIKEQSKKIKESYYYNWFTPKLQIASIALILLINASAVFYVFQNKEKDSFTSFAKEYSLNVEDYFEVKSIK